MVCTSGGDPDSPVGKGCQVKDTLHSVCIYLCACVPGGCHVIRTPNAADYKQLAGSRLNQSGKLLAVTSGRGRSVHVGFIYYALFILKMWISKMFWQNLKCAWRRVSILPPVQYRAVQLSQMSLLSWAFKGILCAHVKVLWFCEEQKTPLEPECRLECMPPHPPAGLSPKF